MSSKQRENDNYDGSGSFKPDDNSLAGIQNLEEKLQQTNKSLQTTIKELEITYKQL